MLQLLSIRCSSSLTTPQRYRLFYNLTNVL
nr:MAG TPA: hypothetical protein [Caudoviricetes sp.]